ncbi:hypothetical protein WJX73_010823 [Symbiochloris irregularis]|uniref:Peptidase M28 domain-containing protein n=1 Tax=Symbiochloris irregularis TaxID=706552 RepID=A0AAW1P6C0_9CHLO
MATAKESVAPSGQTRRAWLCAWAGVYALLVLLGLQALFAVPKILDATAKPALFSEGRAMQIIKHLADLPERQVGSSGAKDALKYLKNQAELVQKVAVQHGNTNLKVQVDVEQYTGSFHQKFMSKWITNAYHTIDAVALTLSSPGTEGVPAVLIGGHFDSTLGSPGASDCASCVAVALETARALAAQPGLHLPGPLVFLLNGGEETFSQGAAGFMNSSKAAPSIGAFINLESTGAGGPAVVFQATGDWPIEAFSRSAPHPRGTVIAQDCFDMELIPADSDYSLWSAQKHGHLPGLDVAFLLDASAYHTPLDTPERIRPGTVQAMGENTMAAALEFSRELAKQHAEGRAMPVGSMDTPVYFDIYGKYMVRYSAATAAVLHTVPLAVLLGLVVLQRQGGPSTGNADLTGKLPSYVMLGRLTLFAMVPALTTLLMPGLVALGCVLLFRHPMVWFGHDVWGYLIYVPAAVAGMLLPYAWWRPWDVSGHVQGNIMGAAAVAALLARLGIGAGFLPTAWAVLGTPAAFLFHRASLTTRFAIALAGAVPLGIITVPNAVALSSVMLQRASMVGHTPLGMLGCDALVGPIMGVSTLASMGMLAPWLAGALGPRLKAFVLMLLLASVTLSGIASQLLHPYSAESPKHLFLAHMVRHDTQGRELGSTYELAGMDAVPLRDMLKHVPVAEWTRGNMSTWQVLHPAQDLFEPVSLLSPLPGPRPHANLPSVKLLREEKLPQGRRVHLEMHLPAEGAFGAMNIAGPLVDWSFAKGALEGHEAGQLSRFVRFAGNEGSDRWPMWVETGGSGQALR